MFIVHYSLFIVSRSLTLTILFIGDIVGKAGRKTVNALLPGLIREYSVDCVIANGENAAAGAGITPTIADQLFRAGIDVLTSGNHIWQQKDIYDYLDRQERLIRPLNFAPDNPGRGSCLVRTATGCSVGVMNLAGRVFMDAFSCPFRAAEQEIDRLQGQTDVMFVDFHAEATAENQALAWYLDGKVAEVIGTHTHVQTADERILPQGTAYLTDAGMTGSMDSIIGVKKELAIRKFLSHMPVRFESSELNPYLNGVIVKIDTEKHAASDIIRIRQPFPSV